MQVITKPPAVDMGITPPDHNQPVAGTDGSPSAAPSPPARPLWVRILSSRLVAGLIGVAILAALLRQFSLGQVGAVVSSEPVWTLLVVLLLNGLIFSCRAIRARYLLSVLGYRTGVAEQTGICLVGQTLSSVTPAATGDFGRSVIWQRRNGVPLSAGVVVVLFERFYSLGLMVVAGISLTALAASPTGFVLALAIFAIATGCMLPWLFGLCPRGSFPGLPALRLPGWGRLLGLRVRLMRVAAALRQLCRSPRALIVFVALTALILCASGGQIWLLLAAHGVAPALFALVGVYCLSQAVGSISSLPFGLGTADIVVVGTLSLLGVSPVMALAAAVLLRLTVTLPVAAAGIASYFLLGIHENLSGTRFGAAEPLHGGGGNA